MMQQLRILKVEVNGNTVSISADVRSESRPSIYHHTMITIKDNKWITWSCSCEASAHSLMCKHVMTLYNYFVRNRHVLLQRAVPQA